MRCRFSSAELSLYGAAAALFMLALFGPAIGEPVGTHMFADRRVLWHLPMAMDVLSNIPFALAGVAGAVALWRVPSQRLSNVQCAMSLLFLAGLLCTAAGSAWYHLAPDDAGLMVDRSGMAIAFAGLLGLAVAGRVSERAGALLGLLVLLLGPLAAHRAFATGNVLPWALLQFGGIALVVLLLFRRQRAAALPIRWGVVVLPYAVAKLLEVNDQAVFELTAQWLSGHTLKHAVAALAAAPVIFALWKTGETRQNAASATTTRQAAHPAGQA